MSKKIRTEIEKDKISHDLSLKRPQKLSEYTGQERIKHILAISITAAEIKDRTLGHILFSGPPGLGKTTLAGIVANEMGCGFKTVSAPAVEKPGDIASVLMGMENGDILFIDEIHRLPKNVEETLYSAMEDFYLDILIGQGEQTKNIRMQLPHFTLIGATTREGMISRPLHDRFEHCFKLDYYTDEELAAIIKKTAEKEGMELCEGDHYVLAAASRGTPRIAINLTKKVADYLLVHKKDTVKQALSLLGIDKKGLNEMDREYISLLKSFDGCPVGIKTIASYLGEEPETIEEVVEPFLLRKGLILKTKTGRVLIENS